MSIQGGLDWQAIEMLPKIKNAILNTEEFESNQIQCFAIRKINNSYKPLTEMTKKEKENFSNEIIDACKFKGWIK